MESNPEPKFQIGDEVICVSRFEWNNDFKCYTGQLAIVIESHHNFMVRFKKDGKTYTLLPKYLVKATKLHKALL